MREREGHERYRPQVAKSALDNLGYCSLEGQTDDVLPSFDGGRRQQGRSQGSTPNRPTRSKSMRGARPVPPDWAGAPKRQAESIHSLALTAAFVERAGCA